MCFQGSHRQRVNARSVLWQQNTAGNGSIGSIGRIHFSVLKFLH